ncbi:MAG: hypothetical protein U0736_24745 [Gemmataceae bacterium]
MERPKGTALWWTHPAWLGLIGLGLLVGGWKLSTFVPASPRAAEQADKLAEVRRLATDPELRERLDRLQAPPSAGPPPFELPGRLLFFAGLALFVGAAVTMYRQPAPSADEPADAGVGE